MVPGSVNPSVLSPEEIVIIIIKHLLCAIKIRFLVFEPKFVLLGHLSDLELAPSEPMDRPAPAMCWLLRALLWCGVVFCLFLIFLLRIDEF